ncbi:TetR/AcrR family transcriptional regulator [Streptomyces sp. NPDC047108]|uniref:TetR/AcrR family transcriptional regulator n=1 Tax=Streptomyces sp. NPDC047108 TaxID=3155025 RepID=UPI0034058353
MPAEDPRTVRTRSRLRDALLAECAHRPLEKVSVSAVTTRAGVGRATFYLHYDDLRSLATDACAEIVRRAVDALHAWQDGDAPPTVPEGPPAALTAFFTEAAGHRALHRTLIRPGGSGPLGELLHRELRERSRSERERVGAPHADLAASAVAAAFTGVLADWLHGLIDAEPDVMARRMWSLLLAVHRAWPSARSGLGAGAAGIRRSP